MKENKLEPPPEIKNHSFTVKFKSPYRFRASDITKAVKDYDFDIDDLEVTEV